MTPKGNINNSEELKEALWIGALSVISEVARRVQWMHEGSKPESERAYALIEVAEMLKRLSVSDFRHSAHLFLDEIDNAKGGSEQ